MFTYSVSLIIPAAMQAKANKMSVAMGHDEGSGDTFIVPLSSDGTNITHYGCHTYAREMFVNILQGAKAGTIPAKPPRRDGVVSEWADEDLTVVDVDDVMKGMTVVAQIGTVDDTWPACKKAAGVETLQETGI